MEEDIKRVKRFENLEGAIKVYKEIRRFKNDGWIESIDPDYFFNLVDYILANSIPISVIQKKKEGLKEKEESDLRNYGFAVETHLAIQVLEEILEEGRR